MWNIKYVSTWVRSMNALSARRCLVRNSTQWPSRAGTAYFFAVYRVVITVSGPMWTSSEYRNLERGKQNNVKTQVHMLLSAEWIRKVWQLYLTQKHLSKKGIYSAECLFLYFSGTRCQKYRLKAGIKRLVRFIVLFSSSLITQRLSYIINLLILVCISLGSTLRYLQMSYHCPKNWYNIDWNETSSS